MSCVSNQTVEHDVMECVTYPPWTMALQEPMKSSAGLWEDVGRPQNLESCAEWMLA